MDWLQNNWESIVLIYLAAIKLVTTIRDVVDKTPTTDDNWFEKLCSILSKTGAALLMGQRPK